LSALGMSIVGADAMDLHEYDPQDIDIYVVDLDLDLELASRGVLPEGVCSIRLLDIPEPRGFYREHGEVMLGCQPLLWRSAIDACHVALGLSPPPHAVAESAGSQRHDARILVAEDHPINRAVISRQLERLGYPHTIVENGQDALRALATSSYDLLITDCHMPVLDGYTLARRIREQEHESDKHLPIVALSASALPEEVSRCRDAGMDEFLAKPVQLAELGAMLSACLTGGFVRGSDGREPAKPDQWRLLLELDRAFQRGDGEHQREMLHRIRGALRLLGQDAPDVAGDNMQQRDELVRYVSDLEALLDRSDRQADSNPAQQAWRDEKGSAERKN
jgi:two-component system sensor histidine kinase EvgS